MCVCVHARACVCRGGCECGNGLFSSIESGEFLTNSATLCFPSRPVLMQLLSEILGQATLFKFVMINFIFSECTVLKPVFLG
jgi:hypothetical protein